MAKVSQEKKRLELISPSDADALAKQKRELASGLEQLEADRRALQVERNAIVSQRSDLELARRQYILNCEHLRRIADEIGRLARTL